MKTRQENLEIARATAYDLVVIGGGINGAAVAQNAAVRGLSVLLVEKTDFAFGMSGNTSKLADARPREIDNLTASRARRQERELLKKLAPHLVKDVSFTIPFTVKNTILNVKTAVRVGLHDLLTAGAGNENFYSVLGKKALLQAVPALDPELVNGGAQFEDAVIDDARLAMALLKSASQHNAQVLNYVEATDFQMENGRIAQVKLHDRFSGEDFQIACRACVNATGAWSASIRNLAGETGIARLGYRKHTSVVVPASALETNTGLCLQSSEDEFVFVVPWSRALLIGYHERVFAAADDKFSALPEASEIDHLLETVNSYTSARLTRKHVTASFSGISVHMVDKETKTSGAKDFSLSCGPTKLVTVVGGNAGNYRLIAENVMQEVLKQHPSISAGGSRSHQVMLGEWNDKEQFLAESSAIAIRARRLSLDPATIDYLMANYGAESAQVLDLIESNREFAQRVCPDFMPVYAEVIFCVKREMAISLSDMIIRRLRLTSVNQAQALAASLNVALLMQSLLGWDDRRVRYELDALAAELPNLTEFASV